MQRGLLRFVSFVKGRLLFHMMLTILRIPCFILALIAGVAKCGVKPWLYGLKLYGTGVEWA